MSIMRVSILFIPFLLITIAIPLCIGIYVYRDAKRRGMNAILWTLIAIIAPSLIGFIVYLLVRSNYSDLRCPQCNTPVTEQYIACPRCGAKLRPTCSRCGLSVEPDWTVCPHCATPLSAQTYGVTPPVRTRDRNLGKILAAVIIVPILLILLLIILFSAAPISASLSHDRVSSIFMPADQYLQEIDDSRVESWFENCDTSSSKVYALCYQEDNGSRKLNRYLVFCPRVVMSPDYSISTHSGLFNDSIKLRFENINGTGSYYLLQITCYSDDFHDLNVYYGSQKMDCELADANFDFYIPGTSGEYEADVFGNVSVQEKYEIMAEPD